MDPIERSLQIDPPVASAQIEKLLRVKMHELGRQGILVGVSGGLDSAVTACLAARAAARGAVTLLYLPDRDSKPLHRQHARLLADKLGIPLEIQDLTPILRRMGVYALLPTSPLPGRGLRSLIANLGKKLIGFGSAHSYIQARFGAEGGSLSAKGSTYAVTKHRLRMAMLYQRAGISNLMVVGAANKTELMTGTFAQWGCDQCADVMPIIHLYRSQLPPLAEFLGLPEAITAKPADPDLIPGVDDKEKLLGSFQVTDRILAGLEQRVSRDDLSARYGDEAVKLVLKLVEVSRPMRESPYTLLPEE